MTINVIEKSAYGDDPVGTVRPVSDFQSKTDPTKFLDGYQGNYGDPIERLLGISPSLGDERDAALVGKNVGLLVQHAAGGEELSKEAWAVIAGEDGNPVPDGPVNHRDVVARRIA